MSGKGLPKVLGDCKSADQGVRGRQRGLGKRVWGKYKHQIDHSK